MPPDIYYRASALLCFAWARDGACKACRWEGLVITQASGTRRSHRYSVFGLLDETHFSFLLDNLSLYSIFSISNGIHCINISFTTSLIDLSLLSVHTLLSNLLPTRSNLVQPVTKAAH